MEDEEHDPAETAYKWTMRTLYLLAFVANFYVLWDAYKDTVEVKILTQRVKDRWQRLWRPVRESEEFRKMANRVWWEALSVLGEVPGGDAAEGTG